MARDPETLAHLEWLGYVQPIGLVVSIPALLAAQAHVNRNITPDHARFLACLPKDKHDEIIPEIRDLAAFACSVLGWEKDDLQDADQLTDLHVTLPEYHETLRPTFAVKEIQPKDPKKPWLMLIQSVPIATPLDDVQDQDSRRWHASPHAKFERLLRETEILLSATYRQASTHDAGNAKRDADNRHLWRMNRQRLDAESIRDSVLAISGKIDYKMHGPGYDLFRFKDDHSPIYDHLDLDYINRPESWRRTVYRFVVRSVPNPFLETLDCADPNINVPVRNTTMTALQALALLNNPFMVKQAEFFAERVRTEEKEPARQVDAAYRLAIGRTPTAAERMAMTAYVERHGFANACRLLFNANEFLFVD